MIQVDKQRNDDYNVFLENDFIQLTIQPIRGGLISSIKLKEKNFELLYQGARDYKLTDPEAFPTSDPIHTAFRGGYFEVIPNAGYGNTFGGVYWSLHAETPYIPWEIEYDEERDPFSVLSIARLRRYPLILYRRISLDGLKIIIKERLVNLSNVSLYLSWLHHPIFGGDLLDENTELQLPEGEIQSDKYLGTEETELLPGAVGKWPYLPSRDGKLVNLSKYPRKGETNVNDLVYYPNIREPWFKLYNKKKRFGISARWDNKTFPTLWIWRPLGGGSKDPWYGMMYATSIEITSSWPATGLSSQVENNTALKISGKSTIETYVEYTIINE